MWEEGIRRPSPSRETERCRSIHWSGRREQGPPENTDMEVQGRGSSGFVDTPHVIYRHFIYSESKGRDLVIRKGGLYLAEGTWEGSSRVRMTARGRGEGGRGVTERLDSCRTRRTGGTICGERNNLTGTDSDSGVRRRLGGLGVPRVDGLGDQGGGLVPVEIVDSGHRTTRVKEHRSPEMR